MAGLELTVVGRLASASRVLGSKHDHHTHMALQFELHNGKEELL